VSTIELNDGVGVFLELLITTSLELLALDGGCRVGKLILFLKREFLYIAIRKRFRSNNSLSLTYKF